MARRREVARGHPEAQEVCPKISKDIKIYRNPEALEKGSFDGRIKGSNPLSAILLLSTIGCLEGHGEVTARVEIGFEVLQFLKIVEVFNETATADAVRQIAPADGELAGH